MEPIMNQDKNPIKPLLPISDLLVSDDLSKTVSSISSQMDHAVIEGVEKVKGTERNKVLKVINDEIDNLTRVQEKNNDDIKKKVLELQSMRENNLVVAGAVSGLKKVALEISKK